jgi:hypothetical protein
MVGNSAEARLSHCRLPLKKQRAARRQAQGCVVLLRRQTFSRFA